MTKRPNPFNQAALEEALIELGCPTSFLSTTVSNYRLFVPLLFAELGEERTFQLLYGAHKDLGLGDQETAWRTSVKHIVAWAQNVVEEYKLRRGGTLEITVVEDDTMQPRLL
jgi:hypothetical protein